MSLQQNAIMVCYADRTYRVVKKGDEAKLRRGGRLACRVGLFHVQPPQTNANVLILGLADVFGGGGTDEEMIWRHATEAPGIDTLQENGLNVLDGTQNQVNFGFGKSHEVGDGADVKLRAVQDDETRNADAEAQMEVVRIGPNIDLTNPVDGTY